jgi:hypothetical protein
MTFITKDTTCESKEALAELLRGWYDGTAERTIGDVGNHPGVTTWVRARAGGHDVRIHADTTRDAVRRYLELVGQYGPNLPWRVERGLRGTINKVCVEPGGLPTKGLFIYTTEPKPHPMVI